MKDRDNSNPFFSLQWHITSKCDQQCKHCYMFQSTELAKNEKDLSFEEIIEVVKDFLDTCEKLNANAFIAFTGGDPLLREDFFSILDFIRKEIHKRGMKFPIIDIMGNPFHLDLETAKNLKEKGVRRYQISIDGVREKHDVLRKKGSFQDSLEAIEVLKKTGITTIVMFTLSKFNAVDFFSLVELLVRDCEIDIFAFARLVRPELMPIKDYRKVSFSPFEYRDFLIKVDSLYNTLHNAGYKTKFSLKDHLWKLFLYERGEFTFNSVNDGIVYGGCGIGVANLSVLCDGKVYACRRFPSLIGNVPKDKLIDIFLQSEKLNCYRELSNFIKCKKCELLQYCRGCGAVAYGVFGSFFAPDPQCWKKLD